MTSIFGTPSTSVHKICLSANHPPLSLRTSYVESILVQHRRRRRRGKQSRELHRRRLRRRRRRPRSSRWTYTILPSLKYAAVELCTCACVNADAATCFLCILASERIGGGLGLISEVSQRCFVSVQFLFPPKIPGCCPRIWLIESLVLEG